MDYRNFSKTVQSYLDLVIRQFRTPKFLTFLGSKLYPSGNIFNIDEYRKFLSLDDAEGEALSVLGQRVGVDRFYSGGEINDDDFRQIIKLKSAVNRSNNSIWEISEILYENFNGFVRAVDNNSMQMVYYVDANNKDLFDIALEKRVLPKPNCVSIIPIGVVDPELIFGFDDGFGKNIGFSDLKNNDVKDATFINLKGV